MIYKYINNERRFSVERNQISRLFTVSEAPKYSIKKPYKGNYYIASAYRLDSRNMYDEFKGRSYRDLKPNEKKAVDELNEKNHLLFKSDFTNFSYDSIEFKAVLNGIEMKFFMFKGRDDNGKVFREEDLFNYYMKLFKQFSVLVHSNYNDKFYYGTTICDWGKNVGETPLDFGNNSFEYGLFQYLKSFDSNSVNNTYEIYEKTDKESHSGWSAFTYKVLNKGRTNFGYMRVF